MVNSLSYSVLTEDSFVVTFSETMDLAIQQRIWQLPQALQERSTSTLQFREVIPGLGNVVFRLQGHIHSDLKDAVQLVQSCWDTIEPRGFQSKEIIIEVNYGGEEGPDLHDVAKHANCRQQEVIKRHTAGTYVVYCLGFQPGFAYLGGLDKSLETPRRATPRIIVPAGAVGIGGSQTGIYPVKTPGGWNIIGQTSQILFNPTAEYPSFLQPGNRVKFVSVPGLS